MKTKQKKRITCIDLFCGVGGLTYGLRKAGIDVVAGVDSDPACAYPYEKNNDAVFFGQDIAHVDPEELRSLRSKGDVLLLAGCAPCQPFSTYAQRYDPKRDQKWTLLGEFQRLVTDLNPELVTMENVPALQKHAIFEGFVRQLKSQNFHVWFDTASCADYGVPQTRKRLVLMASKYGELQISARDKREQKTVRQVIGNMPCISAGGRGPKDSLHMTQALAPINLNRIKASKPGGSWRDWPAHLVAECHRRQLRSTYPSVYGRMEWDALAPTITTQCYAYGSGRFGHPEQDRAISLREAAMLQGFPKKYDFVAPGKPVELAPMGRLIGNAVPVQLGWAIGRSIRKHVDEHLI